MRHHEQVCLCGRPGGLLRPVGVRWPSCHFRSGLDSAQVARWGLELARDFVDRVLVWRVRRAEGVLEVARHVFAGEKTVGELESAVAELVREFPLPGGPELGARAISVTVHAARGVACACGGVDRYVVPPLPGTEPLDRPEAARQPTFFFARVAADVVAASAPAMRISQRQRLAEPLLLPPVRP